MKLKYKNESSTTNTILHNVKWHCKRTLLFTGKLFFFLCTFRAAEKAWTTMTVYFWSWSSLGKQHIYASVKLTVRSFSLLAKEKVGSWSETSHRNLTKIIQDPNLHPVLLLLILDILLLLSLLAAFQLLWKFSASCVWSHLSSSPCPWWSPACRATQPHRHIKFPGPAQTRRPSLRW